MIATYQIQNSEFTILNSYTWGVDLSGSMQGAGGVGGLLSVNEHGAMNNDQSYPTYDGNGNVSEYIGSTGAAVAHYEYDSFGNITVSTGAKAADFEHRFSTKPQDAETGLYYYGYRYYDPVTGRWPSRDPIQELGGLNLYGFIGNDGVDEIDVLGLQAPHQMGLPPVRTKPDYKRINNEVYQVQKWDQTSQFLEVRFCKCDPNAVGQKLSEAFQGFQAWGNDHIIENIGVKIKEDNLVAFDRKGVFGFVVNDVLGTFSGIATRHWVTTTGPGGEGNGEYDQRAITNGRHVITGVRTWGHMGPFPVIGSDPQKHLVALWTKSYETPNNGANLTGYGEFTKEAALIWESYLKQTAQNVLESLDCKGIEMPLHTFKTQLHVAFRQPVKKNPLLYQ